MKLFLRSMIASPKRTFYDPEFGFEYDLAHITPQLIACSAPATNYALTLYRYLLKTLIHWLKQQQVVGKIAAWHIYNLRGECAGYSDAQVQYRVSHFPFPDHQPPTLNLLDKCIKEMYSFLHSNPRNVAIVHCKAGKGRLGTICCAYLMYERFRSRILPHLTVTEAIQSFSDVRMQPFAGEGVSIPSQKRYLEYWAQYLAMGRSIRMLSCLPRIDSLIFKGHHLFAKEGLLDDQICRKALKLQFKIGCYRVLSDSRMSLELNYLFHATRMNTTCIVRRENKTIQLIFNGPGCALPFEAFDVFVNFNEWCFTWFNIEIESEHRPDRRFDVDWENIDGFKGTAHRGRHLFNSLVVVYGW